MNQSSMVPALPFLEEVDTVIGENFVTQSVSKNVGITEELVRNAKSQAPSRSVESKSAF